MSVLLRQPGGFEAFRTRQKPHHPGDLAPAERPDECEGPLDLNSTGSSTRVSGYDRDHLLVSRVDQVLEVVLDVRPRFVPVPKETPKPIVAAVDGLVPSRDAGPPS